MRAFLVISAKVPGRPDNVAIVLMGDAPVILNDAVRDSLFGVRVPPPKELFQFALRGAPEFSVRRVD